MTEPMTMIQELKNTDPKRRHDLLEEALALYEVPLSELCPPPARSSSISARTASTSVPSSTGRVAAARKTAGSAPNPPTFFQRRGISSAGCRYHCPGSWKESQTGCSPLSIVTSGRQLNDREVDRCAWPSRGSGKKPAVWSAPPSVSWTSLSMKS